MQQVLRPTSVAFQLTEHERALHDVLDGWTLVVVLL
jgi:hypothetical protein